jgi:hypothetical protein
MKHWVRTCLLVIPALLIGWQLSNFVLVCIFEQAERSGDFFLYYAGAQMLGAPHFYDESDQIDRQARILPAGLPFRVNHPSYEYLLFLPISRLSFHTAYLIWTGLNIGLVLLVAKLLPLPAIASINRCLPPALLLTFFPVINALEFGQDTILLTLLITGAFVFLLRGQEMKAGIMLGCGIFRFHDVLIILGLFLIWKAWRFAAGFLVSSCACFAVSVVTVGLREQTVGYWHLLRSTNSADQTVLPAMPNLLGVIHGVRLPLSIVPLLALMVVVLAWWVGKRHDGSRKLLLGIPIMCILSPHLYMYDLAAMTIPSLVLLEKAVREANNTGILLMLAFLAFPLVVMTVGSDNHAWVVGIAVFGFTAYFCSLLRRQLVPDRTDKSFCRVSASPEF